MTTQLDRKPFDIREHIENLTPSKKGKNYYECPVCNGNSLSIEPNSGKYQCWSGGCPTAEIREAISPWAEVLAESKGEAQSPRATKKSVPKPKPRPATIPIGLKILQLAEPAWDCPEARPISDELWRIVKNFISKKTPNTPRSSVVEVPYSYGDGKIVYRIEWPDGANPKGHEKTYRQSHIDADNKQVWNEGDGFWPGYRIDEIIAALDGVGTDEAVAVLELEGEPNVESARLNSILSLTFKGSAWNEAQVIALVEALRATGKNVTLVILRDNDSAGIKKAELIKSVCDRLQFPCIIIDPVAIYPEIPDKGDIKEILDAMDSEEFIRRLEEEIHRAAADSAQAIELDAELDRAHEEALKYGDDGPPGLKTEFNQQALEFLFGDKPWVCADGKLYRWMGSYYKYSPDSELRPRIASYCNSFPVFKEKKGLTYPFANPASAKQVLEWVKMRLEINPELLNPPGLNCTNGILQLHWDVVKLTPTPSWKLVDHNPEFRYTYEPIATYNPDAPSEHCDRLMAVLSPAQQDIFLKTIAASLDLETIRKYKGRAVKALLLKGYGSNGKDTLREIVSLMYGRIGMTAATLSDFASYDEGRKFPLARTANSRVNWASENAQTARLDKIQSLKAFITGDTLSREGKGKDEEDFTPKAIAIFNCNDTPNMQGSLEAIKSRYGVLSFDKTFKINADPTRGEIEADPRFKYDPDFLKAEVLPAFLNKVLNALVAVMTEGIDYQATEAAMAAIQAENSHLFQFSQDSGLDYAPTETLTASDIWMRLEAWYQDNGTLEYETTSNDKVKAIWSDQPRRGDYNIKSVNQVLARIQGLFPNAKRTTIYSEKRKKSIPALSGIGFTRSTSAPVPPHYPPQETLTQQDFRSTRSSFPDIQKNQENLEISGINPGVDSEINNLSLQSTVDSGKTGAGEAEPLYSNIPSGGTGAETGAGKPETGAGEIENPPIQDAIWQVAAASSWEEARDIWGDDDQLRAQIKAALPEIEYTRIGKLKKLWHSANCAPTVETAPEPIAPPTVEAPPEPTVETAPEPIAPPTVEPEPVEAVLEPIAPPTVAAPKKGKEFNVGDRVVVLISEKGYRGAVEEVSKTSDDARGEQMCKVKLDKRVCGSDFHECPASKLMRGVKISEELPKKP